MISNEKEYKNRYDIGQTAVDDGNWRTAYDCFMDCLAYLERYEAWREDEISKLEILILYCNSMFP